MYIKSYVIEKQPVGSTKPYVLLAGEKLRVVVETPTIDAFKDFYAGGPYVIGVDGSGTSTGIFVFGLDSAGNKVPKYAFNLTRSANETFVEFRVCYKRFFEKMLKTCKVTRAYYEEPMISFYSAVPVLYSLRTVLEELLVENKGKLAYNTVLYYVANGTWKSWVKIQSGRRFVDCTENDKEYARAYFMESVEIRLGNGEPALAMDITDAWGLGSVSSAGFVGSKNAKHVVIYDSEIGKQLNDERAFY